MTQYTLDIDDDVWSDWKLTVPRSYDKLGDRIEELIEADSECHAEHGLGLVERLEELEAQDDA
jgi:hypothetical protein